LDGLREKLRQLIAEINGLKTLIGNLRGRFPIIAFIPVGPLLPIVGGIVLMGALPGILAPTKQPVLKDADCVNARRRGYNDGYAKGRGDGYARGQADADTQYVKDRNAYVATVVAQRAQAEMTKARTQQGGADEEEEEAPAPAQEKEYQLTQMPVGYQVPLPPTIPTPKDYQISVPRLLGVSIDYQNCYADGYRAGYKDGFNETYMAGFKSYKPFTAPFMAPLEEEEDSQPVEAEDIGPMPPTATAEPVATEPVAAPVPRPSSINEMDQETYRAMELSQFSK
jgi:flagellar biosynthesis/type III secretory pathway protein FliH